MLPSWLDVLDWWRAGEAPAFDVSSDGQRLYEVKQKSASDGSRVNVIANWRER